MISVPVAAQAPTTQAQVTPKPTRPEDKVICRFVNTTGSRLLGDRTCKTRAQWQADSETAQDIWDHADRHPSGNPVDDSGNLNYKPH
jgi:hypothetical protein